MTLLQAKKALMNVTIAKEKQRKEREVALVAHPFHFTHLTLLHRLLWQDAMR